MPNLQSWLNAWVKVNSKTQGTSATLPVPTSPSRTQHHAKSTSRAAAPGSPTMTTTNTASGGGLLSERSGRENEALSSTKSASYLIDQLLKDPSLHGSVGPTVTTSSTTQPSSRYDGAPPPEVRTSVRKHNSKKHKRRLHRTNSFSDLIREQARGRSTRTGGNKHGSVERAHRRHSHQVQPTALTTKQRQPYPPPPPTLHHFVEPGGPMGLDHASDGSSVHSISPSETAVTQRRSNTQQKQQESSNTGDYIPSNGQQIYVDHSSHSRTSSVDYSNTALFGVASFFGTEIDERRPTTASTGSRHRTHAAQHGLEDEQPSYLQPYLQSDSDQFHSLNNNPLPSATATSTTPVINYTKYTNASTSSLSSTLSSTRLNHSQYHINRNNSSSINSNDQGLPIHQNNRYPPLPPNRRMNASSSKIAHPSNMSRRPSTQPPPEEAPPPPPPPPPPDESAFVIGGVRLPFFSRSNPATSPSSSNGARNDASSNDKANDDANSNPFGVGEPNCKGCQVAKAELQITQDSLEYMRTLAISKEFSCGECGKSTCIGDRTANRTQTVKNASEQLSEMTTRHKKQIEQMINERHGMHQKLDKVSNLSRHLNAESSHRVAESQDLQKELEQVRIEKNQMAGELEQLKATVKVYEREREEHRLVQEKLATYEEEGLRQAEQAIAQRDGIITKLSSRLTTTLDTLALEREQQRQRRQIIFPPTKGQSTESANNDNESEEIRRLREQLLQSQQALESAQLEAKQRETALLFRCETLQNKLQKAREPDSKVATKETHYLSGRNGWEIR